MVTGMGNSNVIYRSKIMKITVIKKNRDEKGSRAEFFFLDRTHIQMTIFFLDLR